MLRTAKDEKVVNPPENPAIQKSLWLSVDLNLNIINPAKSTPN